MLQQELQESTGYRKLGRQISLPLLKHQIDKKILKITWMVNGLQSHTKLYKKTRREIKWESRYIQTDSILDCQKQQYALKQIKNSNSNIKKEQRQSLKLHRQQNKKRLQNILNRKQGEKLRKQQNQNIKYSIKKPIITEEMNEIGCELIQSNGYTFRQLDHNEKGSTDKKKIQNSQDDRIFESINFGICNASHCLSQNGHYLADSNQNRTIQRSKCQTQAHNISSFSDIKNERIQKRQKRLKTNEKEVNVDQSSKKILVSQSCKQKMKQMLQEVISKKRKQITDNNLRINILKKIEERYNE